MKALIRSVCIFAVTFALTASLPAAFTLYTDSASFFADISTNNPGTISFSNIPTGIFPNSSYTNNGYVMNASSAGGLYGETYTADPTTRFLSVGGFAADELVITFSANVYAVGGWFLSAENNVNPGSFTATVVDAAGGINLFTNDTTTYSNSFLGWRYTTNIVSLKLSTGPQYQGFPTAADAITLAVPEPSTYALLAISAAGLAGYVMRRRRS